MARVCPITGAKVLYTECIECEDKVCRVHSQVSVREEQKYEDDRRDPGRSFKDCRER